MPDYVQSLGKLFLFLAVLFAVIGGALLLSPRLPWLGKLPGDIFIQKKNFTFYFPLATGILISIILTLLFWLFGRK